MRVKIAGFLGLAAAASLMPALAGAVTLFNTLGTLNALFNGFMWLFVALAVAVFFWGLIEYLADLGGTGKKGSQGVKLIFWSVIALFFMVSIWGVLRLLQQTLQVDSGTAILPGAVQGGILGGGATGAQGVVNVSGGLTIPIR